MNIKQRIESLEVAQQATSAQCTFAVILYDAATGVELTPRPPHAVHIVLLPHNGREEISSPDCTG